MKNLKSILVAVAAVCLLPAISGAQSINDRRHEEMRRIHQGVHSGSLTRREAARLERQERRIHRYEVKNRRDGGSYTRAERLRTRLMLKRESRRIWRLKHNRRHRG